MPDLPDPDRSGLNSPDYMERRNKVIRQRNLVVAGVLVFFVVLFFAITIAKLKH
jgi:hypothetical protein